MFQKVYTIVLAMCALIWFTISIQTLIQVIAKKEKRISSNIAIILLTMLLAIIMISEILP